MKTSLKIFALGLVLAGFGMNVNAQVNATGNSAANVLKVLSISAVNPLDYGSFSVRGGVAGTILITTGGAVTPSSSINLSTYAGTRSPASFLVTGEPLYTYSITVPATIALSETGGGAMTVNNVKVKSDSGVEGGPAALGKLIALAGTETFTVGGTLAVGATQASGAYTGTFSVTVQYN